MRTFLSILCVITGLMVPGEALYGESPLYYAVFVGGTASGENVAASFSMTIWQLAPGEVNHLDELRFFDALDVLELAGLSIWSVGRTRLLRDEEAPTIEDNLNPQLLKGSGLDPTEWPAEIVILERIVETASKREQAARLLHLASLDQAWKGVSVQHGYEVNVGLVLLRNEESEPSAASIWSSILLVGEDQDVHRLSESQRLELALRRLRETSYLQISAAEYVESGGFMVLRGTQQTGEFLKAAFSRRPF